MDLFPGRNHIWQYIRGTRSMVHMDQGSNFQEPVDTGYPPGRNIYMARSIIWCTMHNAHGTQALVYMNFVDIFSGRNIYKIYAVNTEQDKCRTQIQTNQK